MASSSSGLTMAVVCTLVLLASVLLSTTANVLTAPDCPTLFPGMCDPKIYHLKHYDLVLTDAPYKADNYDARHFCRYNGFVARDLVSIHDAQFGHSFWASALHDISFFTGDKYTSGSLLTKKYHMRYFDAHHGRFETETAHDIRYFEIFLKQLCVRQTDMTYAFTCNNKLVQISKFVYNHYSYSEARTFCRLRQGFDLPTYHEYKMYSGHPGRRCNEMGEWGVWVQDDVDQHQKRKRFICVGCYLHYKDLAGVKRLDSNGKLTCLDGWHTELPVNKHLPPRCHNGYWDVNTVGRCRLSQVVVGNLKFYLAMVTKPQPDQALCKGGSIATRLAHDAGLQNVIRHLLATWSSDATVWVDNNHYLRPNGAPTLQWYGYSGHWTLCERTCEPLVNAFTQHDLKTGDSYCPINNYIWTCRDDNCPRPGKAPMPTCHEFVHAGRTHIVWNTAHCKDPGIKTINQVATQSAYIINYVRAEFRCAPGYYRDDAETCGSENIQCAGGPDNYPIKPSPHGMFRNLPTCHRFAHIDLSTSKVEVYVSPKAEKAEWARWVCQSAGMHVYSELFYRELPYDDRMLLGEFLTGKVERVQRVWMTDSAGTIRATNVDNVTKHATFQTTPYGVSASETSTIVCVKYNRGTYPFTHYVVDYSKNPEVCPDLHRHSRTDGFETCTRETQNAIEQWEPYNLL